MPRVKKTAAAAATADADADTETKTPRRNRRGATAQPAPEPETKATRRRAKPAPAESNDDDLDLDEEEEPTPRKGKRAKAAAPAPTTKANGSTHKNEWKVVEIEDSDKIAIVGEPRGKHQTFLSEVIGERGRKATTVKMLKDALTDEEYENAVGGQYADYVVRNAIYREFLKVV